MCAAVGTGSHQPVVAACAAYGDPMCAAVGTVIHHRGLEACTAY